MQVMAGLALLLEFAPARQIVTVLQLQMAAATVSQTGAELALLIAVIVLQTEAVLVMMMAVPELLMVTALAP